MDTIWQFLSEYWKTILGSLIGGSLLLFIKSLYGWSKTGVKKYRFNYKSRNERIKNLLKKNSHYRERIQFKVTYDFLLTLMFFLLSYFSNGWMKVVYSSVGLMIMFDVVRYYVLWNSVNKELVDKENERLGIKTHEEIIIKSRERKLKRRKKN